jgi:hypothetical protein
MSRSADEIFSEEKAKAFFKKIREGNLLGADNIAVVSTQLEGGKFGIMMYVKGVPFSLFAFDSTEKAIAFAEAIIKMVKS